MVCCLYQLYHFRNIESSDFGGPVIIMKKRYAEFTDHLIIQLVQNGFLRPSETAAVRYTLDYLFQSLLYHVILMLIGIFTGHVLFTVLYILTMGCLKHFTGGAHAPNARICSLLSYSIFLATMYLTDHLLLTPDIMTILLLILNILATLALSPVDCKNKRFSRDQRNLLKRRSAITLTVLSIFIWICFVNDNSFCITVILYCLSINSVNLMVGFLINKKEASHVPERSRL